MTLIVTTTRIWGYFANKEAKRQAAIAAQLADGSYPCFGANALLQPPGTCENDPELRDQLFPSLLELSWHTTDCWNGFDNEESWMPCSQGTETPTTRRVAIVGDSHAGYFATGAVIPNLEKWGWTVDLYIGAACILTYPAPNEPCGEMLEHLYTGGYDLVIATGLRDKLVSGEDVRRAWDRLPDTQIVILRDNPSPGESTQQCVATADGNFLATSKCGISQSVESVYPTDNAAKAAETYTGAAKVYVIDLSEFYCQNGWCPSVIGNVVVFHDTNHVSLIYWRTLANYFFERLPAF
jgi:hypothetical protein